MTEASSVVRPNALELIGQGHSPLCPWAIPSIQQSRQIRPASPGPIQRDVRRLSHLNSQPQSACSGKRLRSGSKRFAGSVRVEELLELNHLSIFEPDEMNKVCLIGFACRLGQTPRMAHNCHALSVRQELSGLKG
jgi:hypothetical protein